MNDSDTTAAPGQKPGYSTLARLARWILTFVVGLLILLSLGIGALTVFEVSIDLSWGRQKIEAAASSALARPVHLDGSIILLPSLSTTLQVDQVRIGHPPGWPDSDFAQLGNLQLQIALLPLFRQEIRIVEMNIDGFDLMLATNSAGEPNWLPPHQSRSNAVPTDSTIQFIELGKVTATDLHITYRNGDTGQFHAVNLARVDGSAKQGQPLTLSIEGTAQQVPFRTSFTGGRLSGITKTDNPWPVDLSLATLGADLRLNGHILNPLLAADFSLAVELRVPSTEEIKTRLQVKLPIVDKLTLRGQLQGTQDAISIQDIEANIDDTKIRARVRVDLSSDKPRIDGAIQAQTVDVSRLFETIEKGNYASAADASTSTAVQAQDKPVPVATQSAGGTPEWELDAPFIDTAFLQLFDAQLELTVDEVLGGPGTISNVNLALKISDGTLSSPSTVYFAGVPFSGQLGLGSKDQVPSLQLSLAAQGSEIGDLARLFMDSTGVEGRFGHAGLQYSFRGKTLRDLVETSTLEFSLASASLTYGNESGGKPVEFTLGKLEMSYLPGQRARTTAHGALLGEPYSFEILGGSFSDKFITQKWPVDISAAGGGAQFEAKGFFAPDDETSLVFDLSGERFGGLSRWLGIAPGSNHSYRLEGVLTSRATKTLFQVRHGQLADSRFRGELGISNQNGKPLSTLKLHADQIDVDKLLDLMPESTVETGTTEDEKYVLKAPALPGGISLLDADVDLSIATLKTSLLIARELSFSTRIRDGYVAHAPIRGIIAGARLEGDLGIDLRSDNPRLDLALKSDTIDLGKLLTEMGLIDSMKMTVEKFDLSVALQGSSLHDMLSQSRLVASVQNGLWKLGDYGMSKSLDIVLNKARLTAYGQEPIALELEGHIDQTPILLNLQTDSLASFAQAKQEIRLQAEIDVAQADIRLTTLAPLPIQADHLQFSLALDGKQISDLDELLGVALPPWGPYALQGQFGAGPAGYTVRNLQMKVGQSNLNGDIELLMLQTPPRLTVGLAADSIQLDDFNTGDWSVDGKPDQTDDQANVEAMVTDKLALLTPEIMNRMNAQLQVRVKEVLSGEDRLGNGNLSAKLEDGRLRVDPLDLAIPGGEVELAFELDPTDIDIGLRLDARIENLDYGYLARRIDPESDVSGLISVDTALSTRGPDLDTVMRHANGNIDLAIWPRGINARLFDLWATNLLLFILPRLDRSADSKVNCVIARFRIEDGLMQPNVIFADTTRVQAVADGMIDLQEQKLEFRIRPRQKRPEMFSAQTRLRVEGAFQDFSARASAAAIAGSAVRIITSPIVVPFQWAFTDRPSADGVIECRETWEREF